MKYVYQSLFAEQIREFITQKNTLGYSYTESSRILRTFDRFCLKNFPTEKNLTKEICFAWAVRKDTESNNAFRNRLMPIREFARYLNRCGIKAYILSPRFAKKSSRYIPYIYSREDIVALWNVLDQIKPNKKYPVRHWVLPAMIRLLYYCGLRPCEARKLLTKNVDLESGRLQIEESKRHKSRIIYMSDSVTEMCRKYNGYIENVMPNRNVFFPNSEGEMYGKVAIEKTFRKIRKVANIANTGGNNPRLYDLRHTFATHRLYQWMFEKKDITALLPYLSAYMGHAQLSDTCYYIHFVPELFEKMSGFNLAVLEELVPEVDQYE